MSSPTVIVGCRGTCRCSSRRSWPVEHMREVIEALGRAHLVAVTGVGKAPKARDRASLPNIARTARSRRRSDGPTAMPVPAVSPRKRGSAKQSLPPLHP
jgi:hypothetical protein